jgi:hypothetical protein
MERYMPIPKYYEFNYGKEMCIEIDPQDGSGWPYHYIVHCILDETTNTWKMYEKVEQDTGITAPDKNAMIDQALLYLTQRLTSA